MEDLNTFLEPIKKKWVYNFIVSPKTNLVDKPEWYLNQTLKQIYENIDVIESRIKITTKDCNLKHQFIFSMIELATMRLKRDTKAIKENDELLIHTYNEIIEFTKVIRQLLGQSFLKISDKHDMLSTFSGRDLFERIVDIEWKYAEKNLKDITTSQHAWEPILDGDYLDYYKIPRCVDSFIMLLTSISQRTECFRRLDCKLKLIELQCFLLKKFLSFLKSSSEHEQVKNGANFIRLVLKEKTFTPKDIVENLDEFLCNEIEKLTLSYKNLYYNLLERETKDVER